MAPPHGREAALADIATISYLDAVSEPLTFRERWLGWYGYEFASSVHGNMMMVFLLPFFTVILAGLYGWNQVHTSYGLQLDGPYPPACHDASDVNCLGCIMGKGLLYVYEDGEVLMMDLKVPVIGSWWEVSPDTYYFILCFGTTAVAVVAMFCLAPLGDTNARPWRKGILYTATIIGGTLMTCMFTTGQLYHMKGYQIAGVFGLFANAAYNITLPFYNAYLPMLTDLDPAVEKAHFNDAPEYLKLRSSCQVALSHKAMGWGSFGAAIVAAAGLVIFYSTSMQHHPLVDVLMIALTVAGVWWLVFGVISITFMLNRGTLGRTCDRCFVVYSWDSMWETFRELRTKYRQAYSFLWVLLSYNGVVMALQYAGLRLASTHCAQREDIIIMEVEYHMARVVGSFVFYYMQHFANLSNKAMIIVHLTAFLFLAIWGSIGAFSGGLGPTYRHPWELHALACLYGLNSGSYIAYNRTVFASMIPKDSESRFFAWYAVVLSVSYTFSIFCSGIIVDALERIQVVMLFYSCMLSIGLLLVITFLRPNVGMEQSGRRP